MNKKLKLVLWILMGNLLLTACGMPVTPITNQQSGNPTSTQPVLSTAAPEVTPTVDPGVVAEMEAIAQKCANTQPGQVCFGKGPIVAEVQPGQRKWRFFEPGEVTNLADLQRLKVGAAGSTDGLALLRIQTENPGQAFTVVAFGDVELVNEVPYGVREFNGMQSMKLAIGAGEKDGIPTSGLLVQAPGDGKISTLLINGVEMMFGVFTLEQPLTDPFQLMMDLVAVPGQGFTGDWLVTNPDGSQMCEGSIDLTTSVSATSD